MDIAALVSFGALLVAWIVAPNGRSTELRTTTESTEESEALPIAA